MGNASPFVHAWVLPAELEPAEWVAVRDRLVRVVRAASIELEKHRPGDELAMLRGPNGFGPLVLSDRTVAFNGNAFLGHAGDPFVVERVAASGIISRRNSDGLRRAVHRCDTGGQPYDLAVSAALIALMQALGDRVRVGTSGTLRTGWSRAAQAVRAVTVERGQLSQQENGVLRWVPDVSSTSRSYRSSS